MARQFSTNNYVCIYFINFRFRMTGKPREDEAEENIQMKIIQFYSYRSPDNSQIYEVEIIFGLYMTLDMNK